MSTGAPNTFICLAAGKGTRMGRISSYLQKCMYPLDGIPFVEYTMREIVASDLFKRGESEFVFVVGHHGEQLRSYFGSQYAGARVRYVTQDVPAGTADAVYAAVQTLTASRPVIVWLGDAFFPASAFSAIVADSTDAAVTIVKENDKTSLHHRVDFDGQRLSSTWRGSSAYVEVGLWKLIPSVLSNMQPSDDGEYRMLYVLDEYMMRGNSVGYIEIPQWVHLGGGASLKDYELLQSIALMSQQAENK